jgi:hypothetical protein
LPIESGSLAAGDRSGEVRHPLRANPVGFHAPQTELLDNPMNLHRVLIRRCRTGVGYGPNRGSASDAQSSGTDAPTVPDLSGSMAEFALAVLDQYGFMTEVRDVPSFSAVEGVVIGTHPAAGTVLPVGSTVVVLRCAGEPVLTGTGAEGPGRTRPPAPIPISGSSGLPPSDACDAFADAIIDIRRAIPEHERKIAALEALIAAVEGRAGTDPTRLQALRADLLRQRERLELDLSQLQAFTEEFTAHCPPRPDI